MSLWSASKSLSSEASQLDFLDLVDYAHKHFISRGSLYKTESQQSAQAQSNSCPTSANSKQPNKMTDPIFESACLKHTKTQETVRSQLAHACMDGKMHAYITRTTRYGLRALSHRRMGPWEDPIELADFESQGSSGPGMKKQAKQGPNTEFPANMI
ncbi:hypothetical protein BJX62DRAFT_89309 [Aspergillus germanicus]